MWDMDESDRTMEEFGEWFDSDREALEPTEEKT